MAVADDEQIIRFLGHQCAQHLERDGTHVLRLVDDHRAKP